MGILDGVRRFLSPAPWLSDIGKTEPVCPHCSSPFAKMPTRKTKCPSCQKYVFSRTRPFDRKVLLREEDLEPLEEQWSIVNRKHDEFVRQRERRASTRDAPHRQFGMAPSESDVTWRLLNEDLLIAHGGAGNWGFYRKVRNKVRS